ncbi:MAG: hypothetical protein Q4D62_01515 [Planctomycetia bacterium]|nr:hypothetical protein [Planctomycetia bacterium]
MLNRRMFMQTVSVAAMAERSGSLARAEDGCLASSPSPCAKKRWYRGNLHMHTLRSDGMAFAEEAAALYRRLGYDFIAFSDHNVTHDNPNRWVAVGERHLTERNYARFREQFDFPLDVKRESGKELCRLKNFEELEYLLNEREKFLIISGMELSGPAQNRHEVHVNMINTPVGHPWKSLENASANLAWTLEIRNRLMGERNPNTLTTLNHPLWRFYDIDPMDLVRETSIQFFEVANVEARPLFHAPDSFWTHDRFWDIVNAFRARQGSPLLYGLATDDTHSYDMFYGKPAFLGYVMVRSEELSIPALMRSMHGGDFYASTGLTLKDVHWNATTKTLSVEVAPEEGYEYTIQFIGTKKDFEAEPLEEVEYQAQGEMPAWWKGGVLPKRKLKRYSDSIGQVLHEVHGNQASYTLQPDDLYVRAKIFTQKGVQKEWEHPTTPIAWTQPWR